MKYQGNYLIFIQFLGFRYHGWQKQEGIKTVQGMVDKTFFCILGHNSFKTLGASRTDAMVSAERFAFELFMHEKMDAEKLLEELNINLPPDIRALEIREVGAEFNIIKGSKSKEYNYRFSSEGRFHPFSAPFMAYTACRLDIELMKEGAKLFEGDHDFRSYAYRPNDKTILKRSVDLSVIEEAHGGSVFFPNDYWVYRVKAKGFLRHQVKYMMGALFELGKGNIPLDEIKKSLAGEIPGPVGPIAPSSGLTLKDIRFL